jgi:hypothetical protein
MWSALRKHARRQRRSVPLRAVPAQLLWEWAAGGQCCSAEVAEATFAKLLQSIAPLSVGVASVDENMIDAAAVYSMDSQGRLCIVG